MIHKDNNNNFWTQQCNQEWALTSSDLLFRGTKGRRLFILPVAQKLCSKLCMAVCLNPWTLLRTFQNSFHCTEVKQLWPGLTGAQTPNEPDGSTFLFTKNDSYCVFHNNPAVALVFSSIKETMLILIHNGEAVTAARHFLCKKPYFT